MAEVTFERSRPVGRVPRPIAQSSPAMLVLVLVAFPLFRFVATRPQP